VLLACHHWFLKEVGNITRLIFADDPGIGIGASEDNLMIHSERGNTPMKFMSRHPVHAQVKDQADFPWRSLQEALRALKHTAIESLKAERVSEVIAQRGIVVIDANELCVTRWCGNLREGGREANGRRSTGQRAHGKG
jgi:hypothetical protein